MKRLSTLLLTAALLLGFAACKDDDKENPDNGNPGGGKTDTEILDSLSMNAEWINYSVAVASELRDDCLMLWAAWNGSQGVSADESAILGSGFFNNAQFGTTGYAERLKTAGQTGNTTFQSQEDAIYTILMDGCANISNEVGSAKIGEPNNYAKSGDTNRAVLEVESWYSWNSITDYSDNILSIKNSYCGRRGNLNAAAGPNSISAYVKSVNPTLDAEVNAAIDAAYNAIQGMTAPFRNNLTGTKVDAAIDACADLTELIEGRLIALFEEPDYDFTDILRVYADSVVVPTYADLKVKALNLYNATVAMQSSNTQAKINAACSAWKEARIPWERSEAILFGPASDDYLGLDPSMDSWPLSQEQIAGILQNKALSTVAQFIGAIGSEDVRGFHTIELLLFKDGQNRTVKN
jgi:predicted lipoprotein